MPADAPSPEPQAREAAPCCYCPRGDEGPKLIPSADLWCVNCTTCGHAGPFAGTILAALAAWEAVNRRPAPSAPTEAGHATRAPLACGCRPCVCDDEYKCFGCGARWCIQHSPDNMPSEWSAADHEAIAARLRGKPSPAPVAGLVAGVDLIAVERARQIAAEGWEADHDDTHDDGSLLLRAVELLMATTGRKALPETWQSDEWALCIKHAQNPTRALAIAGALIAAELDRLSRAASLSRPAPGEGAR